MAGNALVDSSFFITRLKSGFDPLQELTEQGQDWDFLTCGVVVTEVLRGLKYKNSHRRMSDYFECMLYVPTVNKIWERVAKLAWELDRRGQFIHVPDLVIAVCALEHDAAVLTFDSDFSRVPGLRILRSLT